MLDQCHEFRDLEAGAQIEAQACEFESDDVEEQQSGEYEWFESVQYEVVLERGKLEGTKIGVGWRSPRGIPRSPQLKLATVSADLMPKPDVLQ